MLDNFSYAYLSEKERLTKRWGEEHKRVLLRPLLRWLGRLKEIACLQLRWLYTTNTLLHILLVRLSIMCQISGSCKNNSLAGSISPGLLCASALSLLSSERVSAGARSFLVSEASWGPLIKFLVLIELKIWKIKNSKLAQKKKMGIRDFNNFFL